MKSSLRRLTPALLLVGLGVGVWLGLPAMRRLASGPGPAEATLVDSPLAQIQVEGATPTTVNAAAAAPNTASPNTAARDTGGNVVAAHCLAAVERYASIRADVVQSGYAAGQPVETAGMYLQADRGSRTRFSLELRGRIGGAAARIWQVSDSRFLWTDVAWMSQDGTPGRQSVHRVDLRKVRLRAARDAQPGVEPSPGAATAEHTGAGPWPLAGGLPMLVGSLVERFDFGTPRHMNLRNEPVYAMIGVWKPAAHELLREGPDDADAGLERLPHHVLIAVGMRDHFPHRIEYRSREDLLSAAALPDDARFRDSRAPLLKLDFLKPRFNQPAPEGVFAYKEPEGVPFADITGRRLALLAERTEPPQSPTRSAARGATSSDRRR
ncbi:MAG: hypothetical protein AAF790_05285 [Planctomycetota bacterium]